MSFLTAGLTPPHDWLLGTSILNTTHLPGAAAHPHPFVLVGHYPSSLMDLLVIGFAIGAFSLRLPR